MKPSTEPTNVRTTLQFIASNGDRYYSRSSLLALLAELEAVLLRSDRPDCADLMRTIAAALKAES